MNNFYCRIFVPSTGTYEYFKEINFVASKSISKFIQNNDLKGLALFLETVVRDNCYNKEINFNILDLLSILCQLRSYCYGNVITFNLKNENNAKISFKHNVQRVIEFEELFKKSFETVIHHKNIEIKLDLPSHLMVLDDSDMISENIKYISIESEKVPFSNLTKNEKESVLNLLTANFSNKIMDYIQENVKFLSNYEFFEKINIKSFQNITLNPYNNSVIEYLKIIFNYDLMSLYEIEYLLIRKLKFSLLDLENISLNEAELHLNLYKKELKSMEEQNSKSGVAKGAGPDN